ncbi:MAG: oligosaccharide flippase family protein [Oscillospiraceae bacterium]
MKQENSFVKGTIILAASSMVVKVLSAAYKIPLTRMLGAQGIGTYSAAFNIFMPFFALATAGITPTVSRLSARLDEKNHGAIISVKRQSFKYFGAFSVLIIICALVVARVYSAYIDTEILFIGVAILSVNLLFATFEAIYTGISQGTMNMAVTAKSNILESGAKVIIGVGGVYLIGRSLLSDAEYWQIIFAFITVSLSGLICWLYMAQDFKNSYDKTLGAPLKIGAKMLIGMALPISLSALIVSLTNFFDTVICLSIVKAIPDHLLMASYPNLAFSAVEDKAIWLFGVYQGLCLTVVNLIPSLSAAIGASSLPVITKSKLSGRRSDMQRQVSKLMKFTGICVIPISMFVMFFAGEVIVTLFGDQGAQTTLAYSFPINSILHAHDRSKSILKILTVSCCLKVMLSAFLCSNPQLNIRGCIYSSVAFYLLVFFLTAGSVKSTGIKLSVIKSMVLPFTLSYLTLTALRLFADAALYNLPILLKTALCGAAFVLIYLIVLIFTGFIVDIDR